ncbi:MAG: hypothetical protein JSR17_01830 [Proteobacteria bacterium]|nr:hypothetical protein [Pseudomonadota bacterium]
MAQFKLKEFVNLIKSLDLNQVIRPHTTYSTDSSVDQLGFKLTCEFVKLDRSLNNEEWGFLDPNHQFKTFFNHLVNQAVANRFVGANAETAQAQKLLGFLLHHDIHITMDDEVISLKELTLQSMSRRHRELEFPFLSTPWCMNQNFPSLQAQSAVWIQYCSELEKQRIAQEHQVRTIQAMEEAELREQVETQHRIRAYRDLHFFDNVVLDMHKFSYVLESFLSYGRLDPFGQNSGQKPMLSPEVTQGIMTFVHLVRQQGVLRATDMQVGAAFANLMKALIASAKVESQFQPAATHLLGFLMFHNFQFQYQNQYFRISDIFMSEMSQFDYVKLQSLGLACMPFLSQDWQQHQCYPGKRDLEAQINLVFSSQQRYIPSYYANQQSTSIEVERQSVVQNGRRFLLGRA